MTAPSRLRFDAAHHIYWLEDPFSGKRGRVPSVTRLRNMCYPQDFSEWRARESAKAIVEHWDNLAQVPAGERAAEAHSIGTARTNEGRDYGTAVHKYAEHLWTGEAVEVPEQYAPAVRSLAAWWESQRVRLIAAEQMLFRDAAVDDDGYDLCAYAGTTDLVIEHPSLGVGVVDLKTGANALNYDGPASSAVQLAAYAAAQYWSTPDGDKFAPPIDWLAVLHVTVGGCRLYLVDEYNGHLAYERLRTARMLRAIENPALTEDIR